MTSNNSLRDQGIELIKTAQNAEDRRDWPSALAAYQSGIEFLVTAVKYEPNDAARQVINGRVREYLDRAEELKARVHNANPVQSEPMGVSPGAANASVRAEDDLRQRARELILVEKPNVHWKDIAGLHTVKEALKQAVKYPLQMPQIFDSGRVEAWTGILLYGPPGTGKTMLAKAVATESKARTFMHVSVAAIMSKYVGESERLVSAMFRLAREEAPTVIFMDEVDCVAGERNETEHEVARKVKNQLLQEMDGVNSHSGKRVLVLAATNLPWTLDPAFMRRLQQRIYIPLPDRESRRAIFATHLTKLPEHTLTTQDIDALADCTANWSGSDLSTLVKKACNHQLSLLSTATHFVTTGDGENTRVLACKPDAVGANEATLDTLLDNDFGRYISLPPVSRSDFDAALETTRPAGSAVNNARFEQFHDARESGK